MDARPPAEYPAGKRGPPAAAEHEACRLLDGLCAGHHGKRGGPVGGVGMITPEQLKSKIAELKTMSFEMMDNRVEKLLMTGAIELENWENDFRLPKIIMCALAKQLFYDFRPHEKKLREEISNIGMFI
jgi:hypothetical protein